MAEGTRAAGTVRRRRGRRVVIARLLMAWILIISAYFLWQADHYSGLYAFFAEIQYEYLGQHWPILTFALLIILFGWPAAWLLKSRRRGESRSLSDRYGREAGIRTSENFRRVLFAVAGGLAGASAVTLIWTLALPHFTPPKTQITVGSSQSVEPPLGPLFLNGVTLYDRTSAFAQNLLVKTRGVRFAPIVAPGDRSGNIRYFVELLPQDAERQWDNPAVRHRAGLLRVNGLPGSIVRLYSYAGFRVEQPYYVLYADPRTIRWPYYVTAAQLAIAAFLSLIAALVQHRHVRTVMLKPARDDA